MKDKVIITGATGMVGEGVLHECLQNSSIEQVLVINRRPGGVTHPKLKELIHTDSLNSRLEVKFRPYQKCGTERLPETSAGGKGY